ncbi:Cat eye syndrome critical region protein 2 homolog [Mytilus edulis]|uniref:Cat eye syndrome critical region protein 2 homolog n=1 Tax=Mytilus edulis TaxID=6550 RepID=A0A8S3SW65_MYTED|nr:Cat eye syndrome critical region protein 2 homolog [Mytilus edulis]
MIIERVLDSKVSFTFQEHDKRKRQAEMAPRRVSARITMKMREFQEQERILEESHQLEEQSRKEEEEERERQKEIERQEEERRLREERQKAREDRQNRLVQREQRAALLALGKEIPPELMYTGNSSNSKYIDDDRVELDRETLDDMEKMIEEIKSHKDSWPFLDPVEEEIAPGYHEIIKKPMDLSTIEKRLTSGGYRTTKKFVADFNLMINNCFQFSGADSELGRMATRLRKFINKCIKIYIDKTDQDQDDEDFHGSVAIQTEKKWRPRRAATSRALDTIKGAFDDDKFEELTSTPGHEYASSTRKKRLIPELSADSPSKNVINGERIFKNPELKANSASRVWTESTETTNETKILTVNGKTFVYKFNTTPMNTKKKIIEKPAYSISESPEKTTTIKLPTVTYSGMNTLNASPKLLVRPPSVGGAILPVSSMPASSPSSIATVNTPTGPKIIRIMSPNMGQGKSPVQPTVPTSTPLKAIRISDGMLLLDGKPTGIHISGKTKIIYRGAVSSSQTTSTEQSAIMVTSGQVNPTGSTNQAIRSNSHVVGQVMTPAVTGQNNSLLSTGQVSGMTTVQASAQPIVLAKASPVVVNQPLVQSTVQSAGLPISLLTQPVMAATPAIKIVQPSSLLKSVGQISSVCDGSLIPKSVGPSATSSATSLCQTFSLSSPILSNQNSAFSPHTNTVVKSSPVQVSTDQVLVTGNIPNISDLENTQKTNQSQISVLQTEVIKKCEESLMGPPLLVPPKRKLSGSPENKSILPPKLLHVIGHSPSNNVIENCDKSESRVSPPNIEFMGSSDLTDTADNLCCDNDNSVGASVNNQSQNMVNSTSASDIFPPYKIAHSNSPDKGNLFEILKTNLTESSKPAESSSSQDSCDSGLSKGMMDKVSTFAASLQSKTLSGQLNIPSHLLQKSPTKDDQKGQNLSVNKEGNLP